ncbi:unnamed protein product [Penicillium bialowiezense]
MSFPNDRRRGGAGAGFSSSGSRTALGYWLPLALTAGVATVSIAAWIWSERNDEDDEEDRPHDGGGRPYQPSAQGSEYPPPSYATGDYARSAGPETLPGDPSYDHGVMARMQGALRRTPSPQQLFDGASKRVVAGVTAAGAFVGGALTSIREDNKGEGDFEDHSRWSEEARTRAHERSQQQGSVPPTMSGGLPNRGANSSEKKKKTVVIIVSSDSSADSDEFSSEHASILSHLPEHVDLETSKIFVLIYAPDQKRAIVKGGSSRPTASITSSYSNIATEEAASADELNTGALASVEPRQDDEMEGASRYFRTLYTQAQALVEKDTMIMPFSTVGGFVHLVRHLSPELVYVQESLTGDQGDSVQHIAGWVRQVIVVVGDEGGRGGLIDSDDESALGEKGEKWWQKEGTIGIGKRIDVVDVVRVGDDWRRRVRGLD